MLTATIRIRTVAAMQGMRLLRNLRARDGRRGGGRLLRRLLWLRSDAGVAGDGVAGDSHHHDTRGGQEEAEDGQDVGVLKAPAGVSLGSVHGHADQAKHV